MPILTKEIFKQALSAKNMLRPAQFRALGYDNIFKGWRSFLIGKEFTQRQLDEFVLLRKGGVALSVKDKEKVKLKRLKREYKQQQNKKKNNYNKDLKNDKWVAKRNKILKRDGYKCVMCAEKRGSVVKLNVHHILYDKDLNMWNVPDFYLVTLCDSCHKIEHSKRLSPPKKHF